MQSFHSAIKKADHKKYGFPRWTEDRLKNLEDTHGTVHFSRWMSSDYDKEEGEMRIILRKENDDDDQGEEKLLGFKYHQIEQPDCILCHEYLCLCILKWWYENCFLTTPPDLKQPQQHAEPEPEPEPEPQPVLVLPDLSTIPFVPRKKGLVVLGQRETGKTKWFQSLLGYEDSAVIHFKNKFSKSEALKLKSASLILIDDFCFQTQSSHHEDLQAIKALVATEKTTIMGKWLAECYEGGLPCVILLNDEQQFQKFLQDTDMSSQCRFINLKNIYIGPPGTQQSNQLSIKNVPNAL
ncbi:MAG: hypothetical protein EOP45_09600 [Sphingobacteriaceae bacterium]|nr:MAG: hypothetical protein EOP45_09600 [Sphingobacteriaceae bacterium]